MSPTTTTSSPKIYIIVGATRGIGLELTRQLLLPPPSSSSPTSSTTSPTPPNIVIATARSIAGASQLWPLTGGPNGENLRILECDVTKEESITGFVEGVERLLDGGLGRMGRGEGERRQVEIEAVVLNAGILEWPGRIGEITFSSFALHLSTNTIGPLITAQHLLHLPHQIRNLVFISSDSGSTTNFRSFEDGFGAYAASKAALNQGLRHLAAELHRQSLEEVKDEGGLERGKGKGKREGKEAPIVLAIHPGEVATDMAANADLSWEVEGIISAEESVRCVLRVVQEKGKGGCDEGGRVSGRREGRKMEDGEATFWTWEGNRYPW